MKALLTRKIGMTSAISDDGTVSAITLLSASPCVITQLKTSDTDAYSAVQIGFEEVKETKLNKPQAGHLKNVSTKVRIMREVRVPALPEDLKVGDMLTAEVFSIGDVVAVTSQSKGKGWAGTIKRHNFKRGRKTHGGRSYRRPGSIGSMYPQKIFKGKKMSGQMGAEQVTVKNLKIALIDTKLNVIGVSGAVPGPRKGLVYINGNET